MPKQNNPEEPQYLYLTSTGRKTQSPHEIEIWFVSFDGKYYILAEHRENSHWVKNIRANSHVRVRIGDKTFEATARVLDPERDKSAYEKAQKLEREKYGWGAGLPVEIAPD
jgi:deazaflavin-dependent oxidoreductase (nitroreductase family)